MPLLASMTHERMGPCFILTGNKSAVVVFEAFVSGRGLRMRTILPIRAAEEISYK
jgi:hypothetical protein